MQRLTNIKNLLYRCLPAVVFTLSFLCAISASAQQNCTNCGVVYRKDRMFKPELKAYIVPQYMPDNKQLFYDSMMIRERHRIVISEDAKGNEIFKVEVIAYSFVDYRRKTITYYTDFSPTAQKYIQRKLANGEKDDEAYRFFNTAEKTYEHTVSIPDTMIDGTRYSRMSSFDIEDGDTTAINTIYYVHEAESPLVYMNKLKLNNKVYSVIRMDYYHVAKGIRGYSTTDVVSRNLSKKEIEVFEAWKKNAAKTNLKQVAKKTRHKR